MKLNLIAVDLGPERDWACSSKTLVSFLNGDSWAPVSSFFMNTHYCKAAPLGCHSRLVLSALFLRQCEWQAGSNTGRRNGLVTMTLFSESMGIVVPCKYRGYELRSLETRFGVSVWVDSCFLHPACKSHLVVIMVTCCTEQKPVVFKQDFYLCALGVAGKLNAKGYNHFKKSNKTILSWFLESLYHAGVFLAILTVRTWNTCNTSFHLL